MRVSLTRRRFLLSTSAVLLAAGRCPISGLAAESAIDLSVLPGGANSPAPVSLPHFPSRLHAFVWRNWELVPIERLARTVGANPEDLARVALAMGLPPQAPIGEAVRRRGQITVIRRNWHLLPHEQLLTLLDVTPEQLAFTLREDDFLWIKLGSLKPACAPLRFEEAQATGNVSTREAEISAVVRGDFAGTLNPPADPLFSFVDRLSSPLKDAAPVRSGALRFCYSYFALYGDPLLDTDADPYPDGYLARLAASGVNGIWLQAVLYQLAPFPWEPARSARYEERLKNLSALVARARRHGISVFLYLNEPRAMPVGFFRSHEELKGVTEGDHATLCTSRHEVREFLRDAISTIVRAVPDLGGFFTISASENLTNCWSHSKGAECPRCAKRSAAEVIAEVNAAISGGIQKAADKKQTKLPRLIAWDWGWSNEWASAAIAQLPPNTALMSVSEWDMPIERGGVKSSVGEYSISSIGPGPRASAHWKAARDAGLPVIAKIQAGNTWELSAIPYLPAVANVARHAERIREAGVRDVMLGWTLGGHPSPNLQVVAAVLDSDRSADEAMHEVARQRFGEKHAPAVVQAWRDFSAAFAEFPYHIGVVYNAPQQVGPSNLLWPEPTGYRATMVGFPYDDLNGWRAVYPPEIFAAQLEKVADGFNRTLAALRAAVPEPNEALATEFAFAEAAAIHFRSSANQSRFVLHRQALAEAKDAAGAEPHVEALTALLRDEIALARRARELQSQDSRIGFEATNQYYYVGNDLAEKVLNCRWLLDAWLPAQRRRFDR